VLMEIWDGLLFQRIFFCYRRFHALFCMQSCRLVSGTRVPTLKTQHRKSAKFHTLFSCENNTSVDIAQGWCWAGRGPVLRPGSREERLGLRGEARLLLLLKRCPGGETPELSAGQRLAARLYSRSDRSPGTLFLENDVFPRVYFGKAAPWLFLESDVMRRSVDSRSGQLIDE
jgi:hypothetical protein